MNVRIITPYSYAASESDRRLGDQIMDRLGLDPLYVHEVRISESQGVEVEVFVRDGNGRPVCREDGFVFEWIRP